MITNILLSDKMASAYSNLTLTNITIEELVRSALDLTFIKDLKINISHNFETDPNINKKIDRYILCFRNKGK